MNIYLKQKCLEDINNINIKSEILELVASNLNTEIIKAIYLDDVEVPLKYFQETELDI